MSRFSITIRPPIVLAAILSGCLNTYEPIPGDEVVVVVPLDSTHLDVISAVRAEVVRQISPVPIPDGIAISSDTSRLYLTGAMGNDNPRALAEVDLRQLGVTRTEPLSTIAARSRVGPLSLEGARVVDVTPDGNRLLLMVQWFHLGGDGEFGDSTQLILVDARNWVPVAVTRSLNVVVGRANVLPPMSGYLTGAVSAFGRRSGKTADTLFLLDPLTLALRDSIRLPVRNWDDGHGPMLEVHPGQIDLLTVDSIYQYNLASCQIAAAIRWTTHNETLFSSPDGQFLIQMDGTQLVMRAADFSPLASIPLETTGGEALSGVAFGRGSTVYVTSDFGCKCSYLAVSTGPRTSSARFDTPAGRLLTVDRQRGRQLTKTIDLDVRPAFVLLAPSTP